MPRSCIPASVSASVFTRLSALGLWVHLLLLVRTPVIGFRVPAPPPPALGSAHLKILNNYKSAKSLFQIGSHSEVVGGHEFGRMLFNHYTGGADKDPGPQPCSLGASPRSPTITSPRGFTSGSAKRGWVGSRRLWLSVSRELVKTEREKINSGVNESNEMIWADPRNPLL